MLVVVDELGAVVEVEEGAVVEVDPGAVVGVLDGVVVDVAPADASRSAVTIEPLGFGNFVPAGTNPTVISWSSVKRSVAGFPLTVEGFSFDEKAFGQYVTATSAFLPASFVPDGHFCPFRYVTPVEVLLFFPEVDLGELEPLEDGAAELGRWRLDVVSVSPGYVERNFPSTALLPASTVFFGEIVMTPLPVV